MATIVNITATFEVRGLVRIPKTAVYKYYITKKSGNIREFPGAIYKKFAHTFIIFKSGKIVCVGGKNVITTKYACKKVAKIVNGLSTIYEFEIKNLVAKRNLKLFSKFKHHS